MKTDEIRDLLKNAKEEELPLLCDQFSSDERSSVQKLLEGARTRYHKYVAECERIENMLAYERMYETYPIVCGIDEVGRGPLAGPVVAACVAFPKNCKILYLNDSKQLSEKKREELFPEIMEKAIGVGIGCVSHTVIDEINILQATYRAMREAIKQLSETCGIPDVCLNDAVTIPGVDAMFSNRKVLQVPIIKGDAKSLSIAAASVVAKVTRDRMMVELDKVYPGYDFAGNKGYGSEKHIQKLKQDGPCPIHRNSFIKNFMNE